MKLQELDVMRMIEVMVVLCCAFCLASPSLFILLGGLFGDLRVLSWRLPSTEYMERALEFRGAWEAILQSTTLALWSSVFAVGISFLYLASFRFEHIEAKPGRRRSVLNLAAAPVAFPDIIWALGFLLLIREGLVPSGMALVFVVHLTFNLALTYIILRPAVNAIGKERLEAAVDLGAGFTRVLFSVMAPELKAASAAAFALAFLFSFDDFLLTFLLGGTEVNTIPLFLYSKWKFGSGGEVLGLASLSALVSILFLILAWRGIGKEVEPW